MRSMTASKYRQYTAFETYFFFIPDHQWKNIVNPKSDGMMQSRNHTYNFAWFIKF